MPIPPGTLPDGTVCNPEGQNATYCTRCWMDLYEARTPREEPGTKLGPPDQRSFEAKYLAPPGALLLLVGLYNLLVQPSAVPGSGIVNLHRLAIGIAFTVGGIIMLSARRIDLFVELFVRKEGAAQEKGSAPMPPSGQASNTTAEERLRALNDLREKGLLTEEEYRLKHDEIVRAL